MSTLICLDDKTANGTNCGSLFDVDPITKMPSEKESALFFEDRDSRMTGAALDFDGNDVQLQLLENKTIFVSPDGKAIIVDNLTSIIPSGFGATDSLTLQHAAICDSNTRINGGGSEAILKDTKSNIIPNINNIFNNQMTTTIRTDGSEATNNADTYSINISCKLNKADIQNFVSGTLNEDRIKIFNSWQEAERFKPISLRNNSFNIDINFDKENEGHHPLVFVGPPDTPIADESTSMVNAMGINTAGKNSTEVLNLIKNKVDEVAQKVRDWKETESNCQSKKNTLSISLGSKLRIKEGFNTNTKCASTSTSKQKKIAWRAKRGNTPSSFFGNFLDIDSNVPSSITIDPINTSENFKPCTFTLSINNSELSGQSFNLNHNELRNLNCNPGYQINGSDNFTIHCNNSVVTSPVDHCEPVQCNPSSVPNSNYSTTNSIQGTTGTTVNVTCNTGFTGGGTVTCEPNGLFSNVTCEDTINPFVTGLTTIHGETNIEVDSEIEITLSEMVQLGTDGWVNIHDKTSGDWIAYAKKNQYYDHLSLYNNNTLVPNGGFGNKIKFRPRKITSPNANSVTDLPYNTTLVFSIKGSGHGRSTFVDQVGNINTGGQLSFELTTRPANDCTFPFIPNSQPPFNATRVVTHGHNSTLSCLSGYTLSGTPEFNCNDSVVTPLTLPSCSLNNIPQQNTSYTGSEYSHNLNLGNVCNPTGHNDSGVIHQIGNKMLTVTHYPQNLPGELDGTGTAICIDSNQKEPELKTVNFTCDQSGTISWPSSDLNDCVDFAPREFSCAGYNNSSTMITQTNLTTFQVGGSSVTSFHLNPSWFASLDNQHKMLASMCGVTTASTCGDDPNDPSCYGEFGHEHVNFPDQMFPTYLGTLKNKDTGYLGGHLPEASGLTWAYFEVNPRSPGLHNTLVSTTAIRRNESINFSNFKTSSVDLSQYNQDLFQDTDIDNYYKLPIISGETNYDKITSYYNSAAVSEFLAFRDSTTNAELHSYTNVKYYYDHIPLIFHGYGNLPNTSKTPHFESFCSMGCKNLVITSHTNCQNLNSINTDTQYVCLPQNLDIEILKSRFGNHSLFTINGYDDVKIYDLNIKVHGSSRINQALNEYKQFTGTDLSSENIISQDLLDFMYPKIEYQWRYQGTAPFTVEDFTDPTSPDTPANNDYRYLSPNISENDIFDGAKYNNSKNSRYIGYDDLNNLTNWEEMVANNTTLSRSQVFAYGDILSTTIDPIYSPVSPQSDDPKKRTKKIATLIYNDTNNPKTPNLKIIEELFSENFMINTRNFLRPLKHVIHVNENSNLHMYNVSIKGFAEALIYSRAKKNIIHGVNLEGFKLSEFEDQYDFDFEQTGYNEVGSLFVEDIENSTNLTMSKELAYDKLKNNYYTMGMGLVVANAGDHLRIDKLNNEHSFSDIPANFPFDFNLCKAINGNTFTAQNQSGNLICDHESNYDLDKKFTPYEFFSPFHYQNEGPETRSPATLTSLWNNSSFLIKSHKIRTCDFLQAKEKNISNPIINNGGSFEFEGACSTDTDCSGIDSYCGTNGYCSTSACDVDYLILSNSTIKNDTGTSGVKFRTINGSEDTGGNRELLQTNGINALIFNNSLMNNQVDMYDLNFRRTNNRSETAKNQIQVIERNTFSFGSLGKTTGEGTGEQIMKFSNNIFTSQTVGGYHAMYRPFYLHNSHIAATLFTDQQTKSGASDAIKPYGVRHSIYNSSTYFKNGAGRLVFAYNSRPKQHGYDYNFNYNFYFGGLKNGNWFHLNKNTAIKRGNNLFDFAYPSNGCNTYINNGKLSGGCALTSNLWDPKFSFLTLSYYNDAISNLGLTTSSSITFFNSNVGLGEYTSGSLSNHKFYGVIDYDKDIVLDATFFQDTNGNQHTNDWGKIYHDDATNLPATFKFNGRVASKPIVAHTPDLSSIYRTPQGTEDASAQDKNRINFLWEDCYKNNPNQIGSSQPLVNFENDIGNLDNTYRCVTGSTGSIFDTSPFQTITDYETFYDTVTGINVISKGGFESFVNSTAQTDFPSVTEIIDRMDISKNATAASECTNLKDTYKNNLAPALHFSSSTLDSGMKLSVYRDFHGVYRKSATARGAFEIVGDSIICQ